MTELEFYNTKKIKKYAPDAVLDFICGKRRIGKTDYFLKEAFEQWDKHRYQTVWMRNKKVEFSDDGFQLNFLSDPINFGWASEDYFINKDGVFTDKTKEECIIQFQAISTFSNRRSAGASKEVIQMVLDEMMPEDRRYPNRCHTGLMSLIKSILDGREGTMCYCLSNYISVANPYFVGYEIYPNRKLDVTYFPDKGIAIEICRGYKQSIPKSSPWNKVFAAGKYQNYDDGTEDSLFSLVEPVPKGGTLNRWFIYHNGVTYGSTRKNGLVYWHKCPPNSEYIYATTLQEVSDKIRRMPSFVKKELQIQLDANALRFQNENVLFIVMNILFNEI